MILQRVMSGAAAAGAGAAAAAVIVVSVAFAIYAFAKDYVGAAGASAITAAVFALALGIGMAVMRSRAGAGRKSPTQKRLKHPESAPRTLLERALDTAKERPFVAAAGAVAAGLLALRNPALVATVIGLINQPPRPRRD